MKKDDDSLFLTILVLLMVVPLSMWHGFVLTKVWAWFVVPLGVVPIGMWHACGLVLLIGWLTKDGTQSGEGKSQSERLLEVLGKGILAPLIALGIGAAYHAGM
jgi:hypothetical protein